jgi:hypothetical protein
LDFIQWNVKGWINLQCYLCLMSKNILFSQIPINSNNYASFNISLAKY